MRIREFTIHPELRPFVRSIWQIDIDGEASFSQPWRIVPDGIVELVFNYDTPFAIRFGNERYVPLPASFAVSQVSTFIEIRPEGRGGFIAVRFEPWGAEQFIPLQVCDFADGLATAEDLWCNEGTQITERVILAPHEEIRNSLVQGFLLCQLQKYGRTNVEPIVREIWQRNGQIRVSDFCRDLGVTTRSLERNFIRAIGSPPKSYARLCRFLLACRDLTDSGPTSLTSIGYARGYYDQSHFIDDFRAYSGVTPGEFRTRDDISFLELT